MDPDGEKKKLDVDFKVPKKKRKGNQVQEQESRKADFETRIRSTGPELVPVDAQSAEFADVKKIVFSKLYEPRLASKLTLVGVQKIENEAMRYRFEKYRELMKKKSKENRLNSLNEEYTFQLVWPHQVDYLVKHGCSIGNSMRKDLGYSHEGCIVYSNPDLVCPGAFAEGETITLAVVKTLSGRCYSVEANAPYLEPHRNFNCHVPFKREKHNKTRYYRHSTEAIYYYELNEITNLSEPCPSNLLPCYIVNIRIGGIKPKIEGYLPICNRREMRLVQSTGMVICDMAFRAKIYSHFNIEDHVFLLDKRAVAMIFPDQYIAARDLYKIPYVDQLFDQKHLGQVYHHPEVALQVEEGKKGKKRFVTHCIIKSDDSCFPHIVRKLREINSMAIYVSRYCFTFIVFPPGEISVALGMPITEDIQLHCLVYRQYSFYKHEDFYRSSESVPEYIDDRFGLNEMENAGVYIDYSPSAVNNPAIRLMGKPDNLKMKIVQEDAGVKLGNEARFYEARAVHLEKCSRGGKLGTKRRLDPMNHHRDGLDNKRHHPHHHHHHHQNQQRHRQPLYAHGPPPTPRPHSPLENSHLQEQYEEPSRPFVVFSQKNDEDYETPEPGPFNPPERPLPPPEKGILRNISEKEQAKINAELIVRKNQSGRSKPKPLRTGRIRWDPQLTGMEEHRSHINTEAWKHSEDALDRPSMRTQENARMHRMDPRGGARRGPPDDPNQGVPWPPPNFNRPPPALRIQQPPRIQQSDAIKQKHNNLFKDALSGLSSSTVKDIDPSRLFMSNPTPSTSSEMFAPPPPPPPPPTSHQHHPRFYPTANTSNSNIRTDPRQANNLANPSKSIRSLPLPRIPIIHSSSNASQDSGYTDSPPLPEEAPAAEQRTIEVIDVADDSMDICDEEEDSSYVEILSPPMDTNENPIPGSSAGSSIIDDTSNSVEVLDDIDDDFDYDSRFRVEGANEETNTVDVNESDSRDSTGNGNENNETRERDELEKRTRSHLQMDESDDDDDEFLMKIMQGNTPKPTESSNSIYTLISQQIPAATPQTPTAIANSITLPPVIRQHAQNGQNNESNGYKNTGDVDLRQLDNGGAALSTPNPLENQPPRRRSRFDQVAPVMGPGVLPPPFTGQVIVSAIPNPVPLPIQMNVPPPPIPMNASVPPPPINIRPIEANVSRDMDLRTHINQLAQPVPPVGHVPQPSVPSPVPRPQLTFPSVVEKTSLNFSIKKKAAGPSLAPINQAFAIPDDDEEEDDGQSSSSSGSKRNKDRDYRVKSKSTGPRRNRFDSTTPPVAPITPVSLGSTVYKVNLSTAPEMIPLPPNTPPVAFKTSNLNMNPMQMNAIQHIMNQHNKNRVKSNEKEKAAEEAEKLAEEARQAEAAKEAEAERIRISLQQYGFNITRPSHGFSGTTAQKPDFIVPIIDGLLGGINPDTKKKIANFSATRTTPEAMKSTSAASVIMDSPASPDPYDDTPASPDPEAPASPEPEAQQQEAAPVKLIPMWEPEPDHPGYYDNHRMLTPHSARIAHRKSPVDRISKSGAEEEEEEGEILEDDDDETMDSDMRRSREEDTVSPAPLPILQAVPVNQIQMMARGFESLPGQQIQRDEDIRPVAKPNQQHHSYPSGYGKQHQYDDDDYGFRRGASGEAYGAAAPPPYGGVPPPHRHHGGRGGFSRGYHQHPMNMPSGYPRYDQYDNGGAGPSGARGQYQHSTGAAVAVPAAGSRRGFGKTLIVPDNLIFNKGGAIPENFRELCEKLRQIVTAQPTFEVVIMIHQEVMDSLNERIKKLTGSIGCLLYSTYKEIILQYAQVHIVNIMDSHACDQTKSRTQNTLDCFSGLLASSVDARIVYLTLSSPDSILNKELKVMGVDVMSPLDIMKEYGIKEQ